MESRAVQPPLVASSRTIYLGGIGVGALAMIGSVVDIELGGLFIPGGLCLTVAALLHRWPARPQDSRPRRLSPRPWSLQVALVAIGVGWILVGLAALDP